MKLKKAKIIVESFDEAKKRWINALKGKGVSRGMQEIISVGSWDILEKILSVPRLQVLSAIPRLKPVSIAQLARQLKKDFKNVHSDVKFLAGLGLIELREEGRRKTLVPVAKFNEIDLPLAA